MSLSIRVVAGTATGPTAVSAYDAALADAGVHNYNLLALSSVVPAGAEIDVLKQAVEGTGRATAALGWTREDGDGPGVFYETGGEFDRTEARRRIRRGLERAREIREWDLDGSTVETASVRTDGDSFATAVVVATYGEAEAFA